MKLCTVKDDDGLCVCCCGKIDYAITLACGHRIHAKCVIDYWSSMKCDYLTCPVCRNTSTYNCYVEMTEDELPLGFFWNDQDTPACVIDRCIYENKPLKTVIVRIPKNGNLRKETFERYQKAKEKLFAVYGPPSSIIQK